MILQTTVKSNIPYQCLISAVNWEQKEKKKQVMVNEICSKLKLNFYIYFTTIDKWVLQLILSIIFLIGMDISMRGSLRWEKAGVPRENPCVKQATTIPFHIQPLSIMGIKLGSHRWETSALSTAQLWTTLWSSYH